MANVHPTLTLSAAERTTLLRDPEAFARRAEAVLSSMVAKMSKLEAEHAAKQVDSERLFHKLERSQATLRSEHERSTAQNQKMNADRQSIVDARDAALAEASKAKSELRTAAAEAARAKEAERESAEERQRLVQINERSRAQLETTERDLAAAHESLSASKRHSADVERRVAEAEAEALASKMQACPRAARAP